MLYDTAEAWLSAKYWWLRLTRSEERKERGAGGEFGVRAVSPVLAPRNLVASIYDRRSVYMSIEQNNSGRSGSNSQDDHHGQAEAVANFHMITYLIRHGLTCLQPRLQLWLKAEGAKPIPETFSQLFSFHHFHFS